MAARRSDDNDDAEESGVPEGAAVLPGIPEELGVQPLFLAVLHAVVFFAGSAENIVQPDAAQEALEYMAGYLQRSKGAELARLREDVTALLAFAREQEWDKAQTRFLKELLASLGIEPT
jgi:hypothetical protein